MTDIKRDISILKHITDYCSQIETTHTEFNTDKTAFNTSHTYRNAIALCILQIGELAGILSDEFKTQYPEIPWRDIKVMRNIMAHKYGSVDIDMLWDTSLVDIPELKTFCIDILAQK
jgi:uncharacterized protein with HEPN domain